MTNTTDVSHSIDVNCTKSEIAAAVLRIREFHGIAEAAFSKRPLSLHKSLERRRSQRVAFEVPIYLYPVSWRGGRVSGDWNRPVVGVTHDISEHGVGFHYDASIDSQHVLAEFDLFGSGGELLLIELRWHQKRAPHSYVAGGLILGVATPLEGLLGAFPL